MSKDLFLMMREKEVMTRNNFPTKKEIQLSSKEFVKQIIDEGEANIYEVFSQVVRTNEALNTIASELKDALPNESFETFGLKGTFRNGGSTPNYTDDPIYNSIKTQLDSRKILLDAALKTDEPFYDSEGIEVPKVSKTERKSSLSVSF